MSVPTQQWSEKLAAWRSSGLSIAAWCRQNAEGYHRFLYWRKRLEAHPPKPAGRFVELALGHGRSALCLECNGIYLHVERGFDPDLLTELLAVLKKV
ncbi:MAG: hypothetical protein RQ754_16790 [Desulfuromonadales bacterium]|nr:hypothetical protein [Desulfuromonadales bacterium]